MTPAATRIALALLEHGPLPTVDLATTVHMRRADVRAELAANPCFSHNNRRARASAWDVRTFDAREAADRWNVKVSVAEEFLVGPEGFAERGLVQSLNGTGGPFTITELGREFAALVEDLAP